MNNTSKNLDLLSAIHTRNPYEGFPYHDYPVELENGSSYLPVFSKLIRQVRPRLVFVVGAGEGTSAISMARLAKEVGLDTKILCIDTWLGRLESVGSNEAKLALPPTRFGYPTLYYQFLGNVLHAGVAEFIVPFPQTSVVAARWLTKHQLQADVVYLEPSHDEPDVAADLMAFWPLLRPGGVMLGNGYLENQTPGVVRAVKRFAAERRQALTIARPHWVLRPALAPPQQIPQAQFSVPKRKRERDARLEATEKQLRQAAVDRPEDSSAHAKLAGLLHAIGNLEEASTCFARAAQLAPSDAAVRNDWGCTLIGLNEFAKAEICFREAVRLQPDFASCYNNLGSALQTQERLDEAIAAYRTAIELQPSLADAHNNLGCALRVQRSFDEALGEFRRAIEIRPEFVDAHLNFGGVLQELGRFEESFVSLEAALRLAPKRGDVHCRVASALQRLGRPDEALRHYETSLQLDPGSAEAHFNRSLIWLGQGKYAEGWQGYAWRSRCQPQLARQFDQPLWKGESLKGRSLLVYAEQGLGDTLQFIRYIPLLSQFSPGAVWIEVQQALKPLLTTSGLTNAIAAGSPLPAFDLQVPLLDLPRIFKTTVDTIPAPASYLRPRSDLVELRGRRLAEIKGLKVGIAWQGNPAFADDRIRSIRLEEFAPLVQVSGVQLISLQKGPGTEQLAGLKDRLRIIDLGAAIDSEHGAFMDTAAILSHLDLVVTSDTAIAHLAGALGVPTWVAISAAPEWRWMLDRADNPWYPSMRLFRQKTWGDWTNVFLEMAHELPRAGARRSLSPPTPGKMNGLSDVVQVQHAGLQDSPALRQRANQLYRQGIQERKAGNLPKSLELFAEASQLYPEHPQILNDMGCTLADIGRQEKARECFERVTQLRPDWPDGHNNLGCTYRSLGELERAEAELRRAIELKPEFWDALNNLANTLQDADQVEESLALHERVIAARPESAEAHNGRGAALQRLGRLDEALAAFGRAIELNPDHVEAHYSRSLVWLSQGEFEKGWPDYDWRLRSKRYRQRDFEQPVWDGTPNVDGTLLTHAEQGFGDTMQFVRFVSLAKERFQGRVVVEVQPPLLPLLRESGFENVSGRGETLPRFDVQIPLLSLPRALGIKLCDLPVVTNYLSARKSLVDDWHSRLANDGEQFRVGIAWQGSPTFKDDRHRSIPLREFGPLANLPDIQLVSLQKGSGEDQLAGVPFRDRIVTLGAGADETNGAFMDTAAVMKNLDLVVTSDTAIAHLGGALGVPTWLVLTHNAEWRWMRKRGDSPWYPSLRLFRQTTPNNWAEVLRSLTIELKQLSHNVVNSSDSRCITTVRI